MLSCVFCVEDLGETRSRLLICKCAAASSKNLFSRHGKGDLGLGLLLHIGQRSDKNCPQAAFTLEILLLPSILTQ